MMDMQNQQMLQQLAMQQHGANEDGQIELTEEQLYALQQQVLAQQQMSAGR